MLKIIVAILLFFIPVRDTKQTMTTFQFADSNDVRSIFEPLKSRSTQKHTKLIRYDLLIAQKEKELAKRREEYAIWKENNMLLFAG